MPVLFCVGSRYSLQKAYWKKRKLLLETVSQTRTTKRKKQNEKHLKIRLQGQFFSGVKTAPVPHTSGMQTPVFPVGSCSYCNHTTNTSNRRPVPACSCSSRMEQVTFHRPFSFHGALRPQKPCGLLGAEAFLPVSHGHYFYLQLLLFFSFGPCL